MIKKRSFSVGKKLTRIFRFCQEIFAQRDSRPTLQTKKPPGFCRGAFVCLPDHGLGSQILHPLPGLV
ncbi:MAG TPA: hypothetical protein P5208_10740, partial [Smithellaceae bacterium]|nr:hypothetical protein [Smithellaceae bacterium]HRV45767.1 hypothetical protein [Smithellaceae bacterium]